MMKLIAFVGAAVPADEGCVRLAFRTFNVAQPIARKCQQILNRNRYFIPDLLSADSETAAIEIAAPANRPDLTMQCLEDAAGTILAALDEHQKRLGAAVAANRPVRRLPLDSALECLNKAIWDFAQAGGRTILAPDTDFAVELRAVDPMLLRAAEPDQGEDIAIQGALIVGCREIHRNQGDLFSAEDEVEVLVSLVGATPEVHLRTTRVDAQQLYRGANRMTANARVKNRGAIPAVIGEYIIAE